MSSANLKIEKRILELLNDRAVGATICPSEVLPPHLKTNLSEMDQVRQVALNLVKKGLIEITQKGEVIDPSVIRGPIRLRLTQK